MSGGGGNISTTQGRVDGQVPSWGGVIVPYQSKRPPTLQPSCQQRGQSPRSSGMRSAATLSSRLIHFFFSAFPSIRRPPQFNLSPSSASSSPLSNTPSWNNALSEVRRSSSAAPSWGMILSLFLHPRHLCRRRGNHHHRRCRRLCRNVAVSPSISSTCCSAIAVAAFSVVYVTSRSLPLLLWCLVPPPPLLLPAHHAPLPSLTVSRRRLLSIRTSSGGGIFSSRSGVCARAKTAAASLRRVSLSKTMPMMMVAMQERRG